MGKKNTTPRQVLAGLGFDDDAYAELLTKIGADDDFDTYRDLLKQVIRRVDDGDAIWKKLNAGDITDMTDLFWGQDEISPDISHWDTSQVTAMAGMFCNAETFWRDLSKWDTSNVTNMASMFNNAQAFDQPIGSWDTSNVTNMAYMFYDAWEFNQPLGNWNTSNVEDMRSMFGGAQVFNQDLGNWNLASITKIENIFLFSKMSAENLSATFVGWAATAPDGLNIGDIPVDVTDLTPQARQVIADKKWVVSTQ